MLLEITSVPAIGAAVGGGVVAFGVAVTCVSTFLVAVEMIVSTLGSDVVLLVVLIV